MISWVRDVAISTQWHSSNKIRLERLVISFFARNEVHGNVHSSFLGDFVEKCEVRIEIQVTFKSTHGRT